VRLVAVTFAAVALTSATPGQWRTFRANGVSFRYPLGWVATSAPLTPVTSPQQVIAVASYRLPTDVAGADGCEPKQALDAMPAGGAFIYGFEYGQVSARLGIRLSEFPPRPVHFALGRPTHSDCFGQTPRYMFRFSDAGHAFQLEVTLGGHTSQATRAALLRVLDSFQANR
jgi:hypothetical protein